MTIATSGAGRARRRGRRRLSKRTKRTKALLAALAVAGLVASVTAVALAQDTGSGSQTTSSTDATQSDVPEGPYVEFCPTPEQTEAHFNLYGFDYKPLVACNAKGEVQSPPSAAQPADPNVDNSEEVQREKEQLLDAKTTKPATPSSPSIEGVLPDGRPVVVQLFAPPKEETTLADLAQKTYP